MTPVVWIPEDAPADEEARLAGLATIRRFPLDGPLDGSMGTADLLIAGYHRTRALEVAAHLDGLRVIQVFSAGVDGLVGLVPAGVALCDGSGIHDVAMAEWVVMAIIASRRHLPEYRDAQRQGSWLQADLVGDDLEDATVAIVGAGSIGRALEARLTPFGARFVRIARSAREGTRTIADLPEILPEADIVVILLPLTPETRGSFGRELIGRMRPGALLVSASRGGVVDTGALTEALVLGRIRAALDVTDPEPLPDGHPLWTAPGALITPHIGGAVRRNGARSWRLALEQVGRYARGEPLTNVVIDGY